MEIPDRQLPAKTLWQPWVLLFSWCREVNKVNRIAWPMIVVNTSQFLLRLSPMFMLGHVSGLSLSSASLANTFCNVTGFSVIIGMSIALETLCGQAYGAEQYKQVGTYTYAAILCQLVVCVPISMLWVFTDKIFILMGQDYLISTEAGKYALWLIPSLFPSAILQALIRHLQIQNLLLPILLSSLSSLFINFLVCWGLVFKLRLGNVGAALSIGISSWFHVFQLGLYVKYSSSCKKTHASLFSTDVLFYLGKFLKFAVPSAIMLCVEWWCFELVILLSGKFPNPQIEVNVLSICMTISWLHCNIPSSYSAAASTRISNELGAGNPQGARVALLAVLVLSVTEFVIAAIAIYMCRRLLGYAFIEDKEVVVYIQEMTPLLCLAIIFDSLAAVLSGVARGGGWQNIAAYVNLGAFYAVGFPVALLFGFVVDLKGEGLWIGLVAGAAVQCFFFSLVTIRTDWDKQALQARHRIFEGTTPAQMELT